MKKAVLYVRVSSKEQAEGYSLDAQNDLLNAYADKKGFEVDRTFEDHESAGKGFKKTGRRNFQIMLKYLKENPDIQDVLVEKTDRLYRNLPDWIKLDELNVNVHLIKEVRVLSTDSSSHEKLQHGFAVLMAKHYLENLSEEVKKGLQKKAESGEPPGGAIPYGYRRDKDKKNIEPNPPHSDNVKLLFKLYSWASVRSIFAARILIYIQERFRQTLPSDRPNHEAL